MFMRYIPTFIFWSFFLGTFLPGVHLATKVPAMLWFSGESSLMPQSSRSFMDDIYPGDLLNFDRSNQIPTVAFIQNDLDVEQFSHAKLPFISKLFDENNAMFFPHSQYEPTVYEKLDNYIQLDGKTLEENEPIIESYVERFNQSGPIIFVLTGKNNGRYELVEEKSRHRRQTTDKNADAVKVLQFPPTDPCIYAYFKKISLTLMVSNKPTTWSFEVFSVTNGECDSTKAKSKVNRAKSIEINMDNDAIKKNLKLEISFEFLKSMMWQISSIKVEDGTDEWSSKNISTTSEDGFSYSCSKQVYKLGKNYTYDETSPVKLTFDRFQIQPFVKESSSNMFEESFDCAVWLTLPILSSIIVCLLLVLILYCGIRALMSISTPDRFENPKSKGLILTGVEE